MYLKVVIPIVLVSIVSQKTLAAPPDAGSIQQQFPATAPSLPPAKRDDITEKPMQLPGTGPSLIVASFDFRGNKVLSDEELNLVVSDYLGKPITFADIQFVAALVGEAYSESGWLARVYVPQQEVVDGIVTLQVIESRFGKLHLEQSPEVRFDSKITAEYITSGQSQSELLNLQRLDKQLLILDDLPGITVLGNLSPGEQEAETDVILQVGSESFADGLVSIDNHGSRSTGAERINGDLFVKSPFNRGDQARAYASHSKGNDYIWLNYSMPIGFDGLRVGGNGSYLKYDIVVSEFRALDLDGSSVTYGVDASYPLIRKRLKNLYFGAAYDQKFYKNSSLGTYTSRYEIDNLRLSLTGNLFDQLVGGGANFLSVVLTKGSVDLGSIDPSEDPSIEGKFSKLNYTVSRQQVISDSLSLFLSLDGQLTDSNLDSAEQFQLGGPSGIRAYPVSEGVGDEGVIANLELRYRLLDKLVLSGFYDWGSVRQNKDNPEVGSANPNVYQLKGAGLGVSWTGPKGLVIDGVYARRAGNNPNSLANGNDQDGSLDRDRVWLTMALPF
jgi:hemolysin activation/secretion protein